MSRRELARRVGVSPSYLSFVLQPPKSRTARVPSRKLIGKTSRALGLPADYFREEREARVVEKMRADPKLLERIYAMVMRSSG
jgi:transcriptional regulator with XRE-family HTH domain